MRLQSDRNILGCAVSAIILQLIIYGAVILTAIHFIRKWW